jgi:hypothetical protein
VLLLKEVLVQQTKCKILKNLFTEAGTLKNKYIKRGKAMMGFKEYLEEMATETGKSKKDVFSKKEEFSLENKTLVTTKVTTKLPNNMEVHKDKKNYYLVQKGEYKGHIEYISKEPKVIQITGSHSELKKGFYNIMFFSILTDVYEILSDIDLSSQAIKAYENLNRRVSNFELAVKLNKDYLPFSKEELLKSRKARVSIKAKHNFKEMLEDFHERIEISSTYRKGFDENNGICEFVLYHEGWDDI